MEAGAATLRIELRKKGPETRPNGLIEATLAEIATHQP